MAGAYRRLHGGHVARGSLLGVIAAASGCAAITTLDGERLPITSQRFADYAEAVFREQNRVATELAFALESVPVGGPAFTALEAAEEQMLDACAGLNEAAAAARDGGRIAIRRELAVARQAPECERMTQVATTTLERHAE